MVVAGKMLTRVTQRFNKRFNKIAEQDERQKTDVVMKKYPVYKTSVERNHTQTAAAEKSQ